jgi:anti-sigma28 factor (negative regulator of flagellin synthesis)
MTQEKPLPPSPDDEQELSEKLMRLRALLAAGAYRVSAEKIAEAMLKEHRLL